MLKSAPMPSRLPRSERRTSFLSFHLPASSFQLFLVPCALSLSLMSLPFALTEFRQADGEPPKGT